MAAPIDFAAGKDESLVTFWSNPDYFDVDALVDAFGNVPATFLQASFQMMKPVQNYYSKYITFFDKMDDDKFIENYFAMEKWTNDNIPVAGETFREFVKKLYQRNELIKGEYKLGDELVDLEQDHLPAADPHGQRRPPGAAVPERGPQGQGRLEGRQVPDPRRRPHRPLGQLQGPQDVLARGHPVAGRPIRQGELLNQVRENRAPAHSDDIPTDDESLTGCREGGRALLPSLAGHGSASLALPMLIVSCVISPRDMHRSGRTLAWPTGPTRLTPSSFRADNLRHGDPADLVSVDHDRDLLARPIIDARRYPDVGSGLAIRLDPLINQVDDPVDGDPAGCIEPVPSPRGPRPGSSRRSR